MAETLEQRAARFARLGRALLPKGHAWARFPGANFRDLLSATLYEFARVETQIDTFSDEMDPRETSLLLTEWENALGLPDECGAATTTEGRRAAILARLTDSGTNTEAALAAALANLDGGATLEIGTPTQFEVAGLIDTPLTPPIAGASLDLNPDSASTIVTDGAVETLADDAAGNDPTQSTASKRPTYTASDSEFGGRASMTFDGVSQGLTQSAWQAGGGGTVFTIYAVFTMGPGRIYGNNTDAGTGRFRLFAGASSLSINWTSPGPNYTTKQISGLTDGQVYRLAAVFDISSGPDAIPLVYLDGVPAGSYTTTNASDDTEFENVNAGVGSNPAGLGQFFDGKIGRIIGYDAAHDEWQLRQVDQWLAAYYGIDDEVTVAGDGGAAGMPIGGDEWAHTKILRITTTETVDRDDLECLLNDIKRAHSHYLYEYMSPPISGAAIDLNPESPNTIVDTGTVSTLADDSGSGFNATSSVSAEYPAFVESDPDFGGRSSLSYDGTDDRLVVSSFQPGDGGTDYTVYLVIKTGGTTGFKAVFGQNTSSGTGRCTVAVNGSNLNFTFTNPGGSNTIVSYAITANTTYRVAVRFDASDGPAAIKALYVNGVSQVLNFTGTSASNATDFDTTNVGVGADQGGTFGWFDGKIARALAYHQAHTAAQMELTDAWLASYFSGVFPAATYGDVFTTEDGFSLVTESSELLTTE